LIEERRYSTQQERFVLQILNYRILKITSFMQIFAKKLAFINHSYFGIDSNFASHITSCLVLENWKL
jgi:hypothetical protein